MITQEELRALFDYRNGELYWKKAPRNGIDLTRPAGTLDSHGYRQIKIDRKLYLAHRLVWLYHRGYWPKLTIDHRNGVRTDNRIENLRECTVAQNNVNRKKHKNNTSGYTGVYFQDSRWIVKVNRKWKGSFETLEEAIEYRAKIVEEVHGDYTRKGE